MNFLRLLLSPAPKNFDVPDAKSLEVLRAAVRMQPNLPPPARVRHRLMATVRAAPRPLPQWIGDAWTVAVTLACFLILWGVFQPGIVLGWQANAGSAQSFRIYRAESVESAYVLLAEIPAGEQSTYRYIDSVLVPGATYQYRVEAVSTDGALAQSETIRIAAWQMLQGLLSIVLCSVVLGWFANVWLNHILGCQYSAVRMPLHQF